MLNDTANPTTVISYGPGFTIDIAALPPNSLLALVRRGYSHLMGSEQASKVTAYFDPEHDDVANRPDSAEARAAKKAEFQAIAHAAVLAGTIGASVRGPSVDPITTIINRLAKAEIKTILGNQKLKYPAKAEDTIKLPDGSEVTSAQLVARRLDPSSPAGVDKKTGVSHIDRLRKEAEKIAAEQAKKNKKMMEQAEGAEL